MIRTHDDARERPRRRRDQVRCPACAEELPRDAARCESCGERLGEWRPRRRRLAPRRNGGLAAALAAIFPGAGHFYCERFAAGLLIMFGVPVAIFVLLLAALFTGSGSAVLAVYAIAIAAWLWQVVDAYTTASAPPPARRPLWRSRRPY